MYEYQATVMNVVDGDTIDVTVDLGFRIHREIRLRLTGIDTHETYGVDTDSEEYRRGIEETEFVESWIESGRVRDKDWPFIIRTEETGKFGRYLAKVERKADGAILNDELLTEFGDEIRS
jgi:micrococcal nuclease